MSDAATAMTHSKSKPLGQSGIESLSIPMFPEAHENNIPFSPPAWKASYKGALVPVPPQLQFATVAPFSTENSMPVIDAEVIPLEPPILRTAISLTSQATPT